MYAAVMPETELYLRLHKLTHTFSLVEYGQHIHISMSMQTRWLLLAHFFVCHGRVVVDCQNAGVLWAVDIECLNHT